MNRARLWHGLSLAQWLGLFVLLILWGVWLAPPEPALRAPWLILLVGPLLLPLRGLLRGRRYTAAWSSMLVLVYFCHGVAAAATGRPVLGGIEILFSSGYFVTAILFVRSKPDQVPAAG